MSVHRLIAAALITLWVATPSAFAQVDEVDAGQAQDQDGEGGSDTDIQPEEEEEQQEEEEEKEKKKEEEAQEEQEKNEKKKEKKEKKEKKQREKEKKQERAKAKKKADELIPILYGYVQAQYQHNFDTDDDGSVNPSGFDVPRLRIKVKGKIIKKWAYNIEVDPSVDVLDEVLRDAYLEAKHLPDHDILIGQQKTQFGYENNESSGKLYVVNRAEVSGAYARGNTLRDLGLGIVGDIPLGGGFSIEDGFSVVNGGGQNRLDDTARKNFFGRVGGRYESEELGLDARVGISGAYGDRFDTGIPEDELDDARFVIQRFGTDLTVDHTYAFVAAELVTGVDRNLANDVETTRTGWYVLAVGKTPWHVGPVVRYDTFGTDYERWTLGAFVGDVDARVRALVEYEYRKDRDDRIIVWTQGKF